MGERKQFDYVIVGAGSAGCVLAARLSEDGDARVALLEAGGQDRQPEIHIPAAFPALFKSALDWDLLGEPEPGLGNRRLYLPRGRMLGGCSSINAMIYIRGNRADYDAWAAAGCDGWSYDDVLPYFKRSEDNERGEDTYHGAGGPMTVSESRSMHPLVDTMLEAARAAGHEHNPDFNGARQEGVGRFQLTQRDGLRCSTADAFLRPALDRPNLEVITGAMALRILFEGERAVGVEIARGDEVEQLRAEREVIVAAGTYQSPVLLMLSGIGPEDQLAPLGIEIREALPVGEGLQDHCMAQLNYLTDEPSLYLAVNPENIALLESEGRGPLSSNIPEAAGFFRVRPGVQAPDVELHFAPSLFFDEGLSAPSDHGYCFGPVVISPTSRGRVMLRAPLPDSKPRVLCNFLTTEEDRESMLLGMRMALEIARQEPLLAVQRAPFSVPESDSDKDLIAFIERVGQTVYHPTSTCAMGSVVDSQLCVYGVEGLRVVDASVMPQVTRGNTNAPTIMIAERAADLIRGAEGAPATGAAEASVAGS
ncbi:MAG: GMC family oxidoreductase N-terminal domain-containing protein [Solirubrobacterales bacterium]|nr:GMC family oxidoreductase N-terminal domain-containing protein [Solirubrobacterales bacterium]